MRKVVALLVVVFGCLLIWLNRYDLRVAGVAGNMYRLDRFTGAVSVAKDGNLVPLPIGEPKVAPKAKVIRVDADSSFSTDMIKARIAYVDGHVTVELVLSKMTKEQREKLRKYNDIDLRLQWRGNDGFPLCNQSFSFRSAYDISDAKDGWRYLFLSTFEASRDVFDSITSLSIAGKADP